MAKIFVRRVRSIGIRDRPTSFQSPWQIGSIRRECSDHIIVLGEAHLRRILKSCTRDYNDVRTHRPLDKDAPVSRPVQRTGSIKSFSILGGLHHYYGEADAALWVGEASRIIAHQMLRAYGVGNQTRGYRMQAARQIYLAIFVICLSVFEFDAAAFADACLDSSGSSVVPVCTKAVESTATERVDLVAEQLDWKALV